MAESNDGKELSRISVSVWAKSFATSVAIIAATVSAYYSADSAHSASDSLKMTQAQYRLTEQIESYNDMARAIQAGLDDCGEPLGDVVDPAAAQSDVKAADAQYRILQAVMSKKNAWTANGLRLKLRKLCTASISHDGATVKKLQDELEVDLGAFQCDWRADLNFQSAPAGCGTNK